MAHPKRIEPGPGQESVWDYPRPPRVEETSKQIEIVFGGITIAKTTNAKRVLETSHPPVYYIPPHDIEREYLVPRFTTSYCEFKGTASYYGLYIDDEKQTSVAGWYYISPNPRFESIKMHVAFYAEYMEACYVDGELIKPQTGSFYGGWITNDVVGPFKGEPGTEYW
ncbi:MAG: DUF427 domain-containing protein [Chloroflexota bacterium]